MHLENNVIQVAIDGPASSGKSTVAKQLAKDLGFIYIDTGAMYRALTYMALSQGIAPGNEKALLHVLSEMNMTFKPLDGEQAICVNGEDISEAIRSQEVTENVSEVSSHPQVRAALVKMQQQLAGDHGVVMDGRDIGTVVLPRAEIKIFLIASAEERAKRRHTENVAKGRPSDFEEVLAQLIRRDDYDSSRKHSPLKQAEDAICIDTTDLEIAEVVEKIKQIIREKH